MTSYIGRHAELYDLFYAAKPYSDEAGFIHSCIQKYAMGDSKNVLELACGTGNHALALEKFGYRILATDYSADMLERARKKARDAGSRVEFRLEDMRALNVPPKSVDAVICLFDSIGYVGTNQALAEVLKRVQQCLRPQGLFIFEFWHAAAMLRGYEPARIRRWKLPASEVIRLSETTLHPHNQLASVTYSIYELNNDGTYSATVETQTNRYFLVQEMASYLENAGLVPVCWFDGFTTSERIGESTWHVVAIARTSAQ